MEQKLKIQIDTFRDELADEFEIKYRDLDDPEKIAKLLYVKLGGTEAASHLVNILQYLYIAADTSSKKFKFQKKFYINKNLVSLKIGNYLNLWLKKLYQLVMI